MANKITEFLKLYHETSFGGCAVLISDHTEVKWDVDEEQRTVCFKDDEGNFYSEYLPEGIHYQNGYAIGNVETGCGQWTTCFFLVENRVEDLSEDEEDFDNE